MKIQNLGAMQIQREETTTQLPAAGPRKYDFSEIMSTVNRQNCNTRLSEMGEDIVRQGAILAERCDITELKRYKKMLAEFMHEAVRFTYEFKKNTARDGNGRHRVYAVIKKINDKLEKLTQDILSGQADTIALMSDIDEINGMIVDLLA